MESNVITWEQALAKGIEPSLYTYNKEDILIGEFEAKLECKIWAKKVMGICCYFQAIESERKFQLTVYRLRNDETYRIENCDIDFRTCPINRTYAIDVALNSKGNIKFKHARLKDAE